MDFTALIQSLFRDFNDLGDIDRMVHVILRLLMAGILGGVLGYERERQGKDAGLRTYMLVAIGAAFFVIVPKQESFDNNSMSRILQGLLTGVGFLGGGAILKLSNEREILGLTTAAGIGVSAAIGMSVGFGRVGSAMIMTVFTLVIMGFIERIERRMRPADTPDSTGQADPAAPRGPASVNDVG